MPDREFRGMSSHCVHALREGDRLNIFLDSADGFHLRDDATKPMIFVSVGAGVAPRSAFLWERMAMKEAGIALAEAALFNGRSSSVDYIYRDEIGRFAADGVLDHVHMASRVSTLADASTSRTGSGNEVPWCGGCSPQTVTSTSADPSRCATPCVPRSSKSPPNTRRCRLSASRSISASSKKPLTTAQISGADYWGPAWTHSPSY
ncbi:MAG: hypothetical protein ACRDOK_28990 [Streptosporangiaceae bacterium]